MPLSLERLTGEELAIIRKWIDGGAKPSANFDYAGPMTEAVLLGCLASIFPQQLLEWDAPTQKFKNFAEANPFTGRTYRPGWEIPGLKA